MKRQNIKHYLKGKICQQMRYIGKEKSQNNYAEIHSVISANGHLERAKKFGEWCMKNGYKKPEQLNENVIKKYIQERIDKGISAKTIESDILTINHLFVPDQTLKRPMEKVRDFGIKAKVSELKNNRKVSPNEWLKNHKRGYKNNQKAIDTLRAFGIRKSELVGTKTNGRISKVGLTTNSIYRNDKGTLSVLNVAKGGHLYVSDVRNDMAAEMEKLFGQYAQPVEEYQKVKRLTTYNPKAPNDKTTINYKKLGYTQKQIEESKKQKENKLKDDLYKGKKLFEKSDLSRATPAHLWRSDYAVNKLNELKNEEKDNSKQITINGFKATKKQFKELSENLGHHRLRVLYSYLR